MGCSWRVLVATMVERLSSAPAAQAQEQLTAHNCLRIVVCARTVLSVLLHSKEWYSACNQPKSHVAASPVLLCITTAVVLF